MEPLRAPLAWLTLSELRGVGPVEGLKRARAWVKCGAERPPQVTLSEWRAAEGRASAHLERAEQLGVSVVGYGERAYPPLLRLLPNAPLALYLKGARPLNLPLLAVVGTREPSSWGREVARAVARCAVEEGFGVVSGLARGIDAEAQRACVEAGGQTWAFLGSGLSHLTPASSLELSRALLRAGGGLLSELPPDQPVSAGGLIARDRLQSGLSVASFVVESGVRGGSLHCARACLAQGRALFVPQPLKGSPHPAQGGLELLISEGAQALEDEEALRVALRSLHAQAHALTALGEARLEQLFSPAQARLL